MRRFFLPILFVLCCINTPLVHAAERILDFHSDIKVEITGQMKVVERIRVQAEGLSIKHGIYRDFPTKYRTSSGRNMEVGFNLVSVTCDGMPEEYQIQSQLNGVRIYIGKKHSFVPSGEHAYEITYTTDRQLGFFKDHDELYWNVTGNGWSFEIGQASASVDLPLRARDKIKEIDAYTGFQGAQGKDFETGWSDEGNITFRTIRPLQVHEGLTILVSWKKGVILEPTDFQKFMFLLKDARGFIVGGIGLCILFAFFLLTWVKVGKDPDKGTIIPLFYPPKGFSPAALRYLIKMGFDHKVAACAIIHMAVEGILTISDAADGVTVLTRTNKGEDGLSSEEKLLLKEFFQQGNSLELHKKNHRLVSTGVDRFKRALAISFEKNYFVTNQKYFLIGALISIGVIAATMSAGVNQPQVTVFMIFWLSIWTVGTTFLVGSIISAWRGIIKDPLKVAHAVFITLFGLPFIVGELFGLSVFVWASSFAVVVVCVMAAVMDVVFYHLLKAPTLQGRKILDQVEGFKLYLSVAEKDQLKVMGGPRETTELFEQYLPYALALDVEQAWAERFSGILQRSAQDTGYQPSWYSGSLWTAAGCVGFMSSLGSSMAGSISSASTAPGSSSGGGGGGSSGGGGGGGGGGGW